MVRTVHSCSRTQCCLNVSMLIEIFVCFHDSNARLRRLCPVPCCRKQGRSCGSTSRCVHALQYIH
jgi:hypothetical protein